MKLYFFQNRNDNVYVGTVKPKKWWYEGDESGFGLPAGTKNAQLPLCVCLPIAKKILRGTGKKLPKQGSSEVVMIEATFKGD